MSKTSAENNTFLHESPVNIKDANKYAGKAFSRHECETMEQYFICHRIGI